MTESQAQITIEDRKYWRAPSNLNPTLTENGLPYSYNYQKLFRLGFISQSFLNEEKFMFTLFNSNLTLLNLKLLDKTHNPSLNHSIFEA